MHIGKTSFILFAAILALASGQANPGMQDKKPAVVTSPLKRFKIVTMNTRLGSIRIRLHWDAAPRTCLNFIKLAKKGFYKGIIFHRVIKNFMIQGGDPTGTGTGGPGYKFADEINADALGLANMSISKALLQRRTSTRDLYMAAIRKLKIKTKSAYMARTKEIKRFVKTIKNTWTLKRLFQYMGYTYTSGLKSRKAERGSLAMANSGPDTNGSQFFINVVHTPWLNGKHTVFGTVIGGMPVVDSISKVPTGAGSKPRTPVTIKQISLE